MNSTAICMERDNNAQRVGCRLLTTVSERHGKEQTKPPR
jgi:hypothetical protein